MRAEGGRSFKIDRAETDLPEPLSPTSPTVSPGAIEKDTLETRGFPVPDYGNRWSDFQF